MVSQHSYGRLLLGIVTLASLMTALMYADHLGEPIYSATFADALAEGAYVPKWSNGLLFHVQRSQMTKAESGPNLAVYDKTGRAVLKTRVWVPDAWKVMIHDEAASTEGGMAVVGVAFTNSGIRAGFLVQLRASGEMIRIVRTSPFEAQKVCFGPDGSLWLAGEEVPTDLWKRSEVPDHAILQHYGADGRLIAKFLPKSAFNVGEWHPISGPEGYAHLVAAKDRIGLLTVADPQWIEMTSDGSVTRRLAVKPLGAVDRDGQTQPRKVNKMTGLVMTADHNVYASFQDKNLYRLDRSTGEWFVVQLDRAGAPPDFAGLVGADGNSLVYARPFSVLSWSDVRP